MIEVVGQRILFKFYKTKLAKLVIFNIFMIRLKNKLSRNKKAYKIVIKKKEKEENYYNRNQKK